MKTIFSKIFINITECFSGYNLLLHIVAIFLTIILVFSGFDLFYFKYFSNTTLRSLLLPAVVLGGFLPIILPLIIYFTGKIIKQTKITVTSFALAQSEIIGLLISSAYKFFTGRVPPRAFYLVNGVDGSRIFNFGFMRGGVFWGWPSSHATVAFAMATTLFILFPKNKILRWGVLIYSFYVGLGVSMSIHWFSDFVAGAIIGSVVGITVGKAFIVIARS